MASIYRRGNRFWVSYYVNNKQIKRSLGTSNERVARSRLKKLEYESEQPFSAHKEGDVSTVLSLFNIFYL